MAVSEPEPIRLGLIGTGLAIEKLHWPALRRLTDRFTVTAFADLSAEQGTHFAAYSGLDSARFSTDYHRLLGRDDVDAVLITVPIPHLYQVARDSLAAGKDVICEKPTGTDEKQGLAFLELPNEYPGRTVLIAENCFYRDDIRLARSLVDDGAIGTPHLVSWRATGRTAPRAGSFTSTPWRHQPQYRGGAHLDSGIHHIAQIRMLCGTVARAHGAVQWANSIIDAPADLTLNMTFDSGAIGNYTATYSDMALPDESNEMRLYGTEGVLAVAHSRGELQVRVSRADGTTQTHLIRGIDGGYYGELCNFADAVQYGEPVVGTIAQSFANMLVVLRALDSAEQGVVVPVDDRAGNVALWRPRGASGLFDGLPGERVVNTDSA